MPDGAAAAPAAARVGGTTYRFATNSIGLERITLDFGTAATRLTLVDAHGTHVVDCGVGEWLAGRSALQSTGEVAIAAAGAWADDDSYVATVYFTTTPFAITLAFDFRSDEVTLTVEQNVSFGPRRLLHTVGRIEKIDQE